MDKCERTIIMDKCERTTIMDYPSILGLEKQPKKESEKLCAVFAKWRNEVNKNKETK